MNYKIQKDSKAHLQLLWRQKGTDSKSENDLWYHLMVRFEFEFKLKILLAAEIDFI